jgi:hypothetical protein
VCGFLSLADDTLSLLGPGAKNLLPKLTDKTLPLDERVDIKKTPRSLDIREWALVVRAFKEWPFRPEVLSFFIIKKLDYFCSHSYPCPAGALNRSFFRQSLESKLDNSLRHDNAYA